MNALTSQQKTAIHRARKAAKDFSIKCLEKEEVVTTLEKFIIGKEVEACKKNMCRSVQFDAPLTNLFYEKMKEYDSEDKMYGIDDMLYEWKQAEKELRG